LRIDDDDELLATVRERLADPQPPISVSFESLLAVSTPVSVAQVAHIRSLVDGVEFDLDAPLLNDESDDVD